MSKHYEFTHRSVRQRLALVGLKLIVAAYVAAMIHSLGWDESGTETEKLRWIGGALIGIWVYSNLCRVKTEIQELFIEPMDIRHAGEVLLVGIAMMILGYLLPLVF